jgi:hypothetical protein
VESQDREVGWLEKSFFVSSLFLKRESSLLWNTADFSRNHQPGNYSSGNQEVRKGTGYKIGDFRSILDFLSS